MAGKRETGKRLDALEVLLMQDDWSIELIMQNTGCSKAHAHRFMRQIEKKSFMRLTNKERCNVDEIAA